ncbi:MAG: ABC transporter ATP-binding protein [Planctomycetaceae bacterium]
MKTRYFQESGAENDSADVIQAASYQRTGFGVLNDPSSTIDPPLIEASRLGLTFANGQAALADVSFSLHQGEFIGILGPSGCGKSSLLRLIAGLIRPTSGTLSRSGEGSSGGDGHALRTGFAFQDSRLLAWRDVRENIRLPLELARLSRSVQDQYVAESLRLIGLSAGDAGKYPRMLSGGMRMRVSLARSLAMNPALLLLDEPFAALDDMLRNQLNEELLRIWRRQGWTAVFVTHNVFEALFLSQRVLLMSPGPGRILHEITVPFAYPRSPQLRTDPRFAQLAGDVIERLREERA